MVSRDFDLKSKSFGNCLVLGAFLLLAFLLFANSFSNQWTMDDFMVVVRNPDIRSFQGFLADSYPGRPLRELTYLIDYALFGQDPAGYHIQNIFWHGLNAFLVFVLVRRLKGTMAAAWVAGLVFLSHPIVTEVIGNISHRKDSLALAFSLLSFLAYLQVYVAEKKKYLWLLMALLIGGVAVLAKEQAVALLPLFFLYDISIRPISARLICKRRWVAPGALLSVATGFIIWYVWLWRNERFLESLSEGLVKMNYYSGWSPEAYFTMTLKSMAFMASKLVVPLNLAMEYVYTVPVGWAEPWVVAGLSLVGLAVLGLVFFQKGSPLAFIALCWLIVFWLPVSNFFWPLSYFAADRYLYSPCAGFAILFALLLENLLASRRAAFCVVVVGILAILAAGTWRQNRVWSSELALFTQAVKVSPDSTMGLSGLGLAYLNGGEAAAALPWLEKAAQNYNDSKPLHLLGIAHERLGNRQQALRYYSTFVSMNEPKYRADVQSVKMYLTMKYGVK